MSDDEKNRGFSISAFQRELLQSPPQIPDLQIRNPLITTMEDNYASAFYKRLGKWIADFDASIDSSLEVGVRLVSFGQAVVFHLESMGYWNPSLISFSGHTDEGSPVELIQHVSQISILLTSLPRKDPSKPKIGFALKSDEEEA